MTPVVLDLHTHSPLVPSDYRGPAETGPRDLVASAIAAGLGLVAITDHFSVSYVRQVERAAHAHVEQTGVRLAVVPGAEIKVAWGPDEAHLIALLPPDGHVACFEELARGFGIDASTICVSDLPAVKVRAHPIEVARRIESLGGLCHIGHADRYFGAYRLLDTPLFDELATDDAIRAIELVDPANAAEVKRRVPGARVIASSDAHSPAEYGQRHTVLDLHEASFAGLARAFGR